MCIIVNSGECTLNLHLLREQVFVQPVTSDHFGSQIDGIKVRELYDLFIDSAESASTTHISVLHTGSVKSSEKFPRAREMP